MLRLWPRSPGNTNIKTLPWTCITCRTKAHLQWQSYRASSNSSSPPPKPHTPSKITGRSFRPLQPLLRPLGVDVPPRPGDNSAKDTRPWHVRREEYWDREKHAERRRKIMKEISTPYFRDWNRMKYNDGKTFIAPESLLKAEAAKYIPNMQGYTLAQSWSYHDTTTVLKGKVSILSIASGTWAQNQVISFVGNKENPKLTTLFEELGAQGLQRVWINLERDFFKAMLVRLFLPYARRSFPKQEDRKRSFVMRKGVDRELLESFGMTNTKVGHIFLIDRNCKIRWAGNGDANDEERANLARLARRLVETSVESKKTQTPPKPPKKPGLASRW